MSEIIIKDNATDGFAHDLRFLALQKDFSSVEYDGNVYKGMAECDKDLALEVADYCIGHRDIQINESFFRLETKYDEPTSWIHSDGICGAYSLVLYLCDGPGGTAFWKHRSTGRHSLPDKLNDLPKDVATDYVNIFKSDDSRRDAWDMTAFAGLRMDRSVLYPANIFHSRFPYSSFGEAKEDSRLIFVAFFNQ